MVSYFELYWNYFELLQLILITLASQYSIQGCETHPYFEIRQKVTFSNYQK